MTRWTLRRTSDDETEDMLFDSEVVDAFNRFARHAVAWIDDSDGDRFDLYPRGTAVELYHPDQDPDTDDARFSGFVVERSVGDNSGADELTVEIYSYDHFLRRNNVTRDFDGDSIADALEEVVTDFTPVEWVSGNVEIVDDETLTRSFEGEKVDNLISELASKSGNEEFGVNDDLEFFFRPRETTSAPRDVNDTQWFDYEFPEEGKQSINEVNLFYGEGGETGSVVVTDGNDKLALQESIGTDGPVTFRREVTREDITDEADARDKAEEILNESGTTIAGSVTTYELYDAEPGEVLDVEISSEGIDDEFRIAEISYRGGDEQTVLKLVEVGESQDDKLIRMSDTLDRVEQRAADRDVPTVQYEGPLVSRGQFVIEGEVAVQQLSTSRLNLGFGRDEAGFGRPEPGLNTLGSSVSATTSSRATNDFISAIRDAWIAAGSIPDIDELAVGTGTSSPSRTDTALEDEEDSDTASLEIVDGTVAQFDATITPTSDYRIREVALKNEDGDLYTRSSIDPVDASAGVPVDVTLSVSVIDDPDAEVVLTDAGSEAVASLIEGVDIELPVDMGFGSGGTPADVSDTDLEDEIDTTSAELGARGVAELDVTATWENETGGSETVREVGLISDDDRALSRVVVADLVVEDGDELNATIRQEFIN